LTGSINRLFLAFLNYWSQHPISQKRDTILGLVDRVFLFLHPEFHQKNLEFIVKILLNNDYTLDLIFKVMTNRKKSLVNMKTLKQRDIFLKNVNEQKFNWFMIPYLHSFAYAYIVVVVVSGNADGPKEALMSPRSLDPL